MKFLKSFIIITIISCATKSFGVTGDFIPNKKELRAKYSYLYKEKIKEISHDHKTFYNAHLFKRNGLNILYLVGDEFEMAFQHGKLLTNENRDGAIQAAANMVNNAINVTFEHKPVLRNLAKKRIDKTYTTKFLENVIKSHPQLSRSVLNRSFAVAEAAGIPINTVLDASLNPSVMMMLANRDKSEDEVGFSASPANGCTSFGLWDDYSIDGELIVGRNTDYPLGGSFEKNATVIYFQPTDGGQRFMSVTTAGVHTASVTAVNEKGLYIGTHSLPSKYTGVVGVPMITWMHDVIAKAETIDEAVKILKSRKTGVGWTYVLASPSEKRVVSLEVDNKEFGLRESFDGKHIQTNHYLTPNMFDHTLAFNRGVYEETYSRYRRADKLIEAGKGSLSPVDIIRILGDQTDDFTGELNGFPSNIGATTTVSSLIYEPSQNRIFVATGTAPVAHNEYVELPLPRDFDPASFATTSLNTIENKWFSHDHANKFEALKTYILAKQTFESTYNTQTTLAYVRKAASLAPEVGHYRLMQGLVEIRDNKFASAYKSFESSLNSKLSTHGKNLAYLYMARILADSAKASQSNKILEKIVANPQSDSKIRQAAQDLRNQLKRNSRVHLYWHQVIPLFQFGDVQSY